MNNLDRDWHLTHRMPDRATLEQWIEWHLEHQHHCGCREMPAKIRAAIESRKGDAVADVRRRVEDA